MVDRVIVRYPHPCFHFVEVTVLLRLRSFTVSYKDTFLLCCVVVTVSKRFLIPSRTRQHFISVRVFGPLLSGYKLRRVWSSRRVMVLTRNVSMTLRSGNYCGFNEFSDQRVRRSVC